MSEGEKTSIEGALSGVAGVLETEVVKQAYADLLQPLLKATGDAGATAIRLLVQQPIEAIATMPQKLIGLAERIRNRVPEDRLLEAPAEVAGPVLEGIRYLHEGHPLFEMYEELLARSCDRETKDAVNPAFAEIIKLLSPDEARILYWIWQQDRQDIKVLRKVARRYKSAAHKAKGFAQYGTEITCVEIPYWILGNSALYCTYGYLEHVEKIGLIMQVDVDWHNSGNQRVDVYKMMVTAYGDMFCSVCIPPTGIAAYYSDFHPSHWEYANASSGI